MITPSEGPNQVTFQVDALYGVSRQNVQLPISEERTIDSGPVSISLDPHAHRSSNIGLVDFPKQSLVVRYGIQVVFPGLWSLRSEGEIDPVLLNPIRATAIDQCVLLEGGRGWRADGCLEFLPGSFWAGTEGG